MLEHLQIENASCSKVSFYLNDIIVEIHYSHVVIFSGLQAKSFLHLHVHM